MILVSACLLGLPCRYDGQSKPVERLQQLAAQGQVLCVCPEVMGGLPTPRIPSERQGQRVVNHRGEDVTAQFLHGASLALQCCQSAGCTAAVLKARSPSCGYGQIYDGSFSGQIVNGNGVFAELLQQAGVTILTEEEFLALPEAAISLAVQGRRKQEDQPCPWTD